jgi:hypothetical protein
MRKLLIVILFTIICGFSWQPYDEENIAGYESREDYSFHDYYYYEGGAIPGYQKIRVGTRRFHYNVWTKCLIRAPWGKTAKKMIHVYPNIEFIKPLFKGSIAIKFYLKGKFCMTDGLTYMTYITEEQYNKDFGI